MEVRTDRPKAKKIQELHTKSRKAIAFDIQLSNPLDETVFFDVSIEGTGLYGPAIFDLGPKKTETYELMFLPMRPSREQG